MNAAEFGRVADAVANARAEYAGKINASHGINAVITELLLTFEDEPEFNPLTFLVRCGVERVSAERWVMRKLGAEALGRAVHEEV